MSMFFSENSVSFEMMIKTKALDLTSLFSKNVQRGWKEEPTKTGFEVTENGAKQGGDWKRGNNGHGFDPLGVSPATPVGRLPEQPHTLIAREWGRITVHNTLYANIKYAKYKYKIHLGVM